MVALQEGDYYTYVRMLTGCVMKRNKERFLPFIYNGCDFVSGEMEPVVCVAVLLPPSHQPIARTNAHKRTHTHRLNDTHTPEHPHLHAYSVTWLRSLR